MLSARTWTLLMLIGTASLAGCLGTEEGADPLDPDDPDDLDDLDTGNATTPPSGLPALVPALSADILNGSAPLLVNITLVADGADDNTTWSIDFGDGNTTDGDALPATVNHTFGPGNHTVTATLQRGNETATTNLTVVAVVAATGPALPETTHFEFGDSLGCAGDFIAIVEGEAHLGLNCVSFMEGPSASGIDGYWQELDAAYWGLQLTSTVDQGAGEAGAQGFLADSDCYFTDADFAIIGEGNNGGDPCAGAVPEGTQWLFIYPYAAPGLSMTVDFALP